MAADRARLTSNIDLESKITSICVSWEFLRFGNSKNFLGIEVDTQTLTSTGTKNGQKWQKIENFEKC